MPEISFNKTRVPAQTDMWDLAPDIKRMAETSYVVIPVASKAERDALTPLIPSGTVVLRTDLSSVMPVFDAYISGVWVEGGQEYRHFVPDSVNINAATGVYTAIAPMKGGPGDGGTATGMTYAAGKVTVTKAGRYVLDGQVTFMPGTASTRVAAFNVGGTLYRSWAAGVSLRHTKAIHKELFIAAGTTVGLEAFQDSGATLALNTDADQTCWTIRRVA